MDKYWSSRLKNVEPYVPGEQPKDGAFIKLNTNENPYPPSPKALEAIRAAACDTLRLYPKPEYDGLREAAAEAFGLEPEQIYAGNGSDEVLATAFLAFFAPGSRIVFPDISYSFYPVYADLFGIEYDTVPLRGDFTVDVEGMTEKSGGVVVANPNAPTGIALGLSDIEYILGKCPDRVVIVDEAYVDFGCESAVPLINRYPNLLVVQTMSKSRSFAGLRVGFAFGQKSLIDAMSAVKNSFNSYTLDRLAQAGAEASVRDREYFDMTRERIIATRARTSAELGKLGFTVLPSSANFIFASHRTVPAERIFTELRAMGILVRYFKKPRIDNFLRITIGTDDEMDALCAALRKITE
jgi:histidinol-phosphate aminotransferase